MLPYPDDQPRLNVALHPYDLSGRATSENAPHWHAPAARKAAVNSGVICFTKGTEIATPDGDVPIEHLRVGAQVLTCDNGPKPIKWIGMRRLGQRAMTRRAHLKPIVISPRLLGTAHPLLVSPEHSILLDLEGQDCFVRAKHLAQLPGGQARIAQGVREVVYFHLLLERHQAVFANGALTDSFYPTPQAMKALKPKALQAIDRLVPDLECYGLRRAYGSPARRYLPRKAMPETISAFLQVKH
ncbi:MAG: Hint domain-containing protein [Pseudomonadota bacterium]